MTNLASPCRTPRPGRAAIARGAWLPVLVLAAVLAGCGKSEPPTAGPSADKAAVAPPGPSAVDAMSVVLDETLASRVTVGEVGTRRITETIRIAGRLDLNQYRTARIGAPITGRITEIDVGFGQQVRAGQRLALLSSPDLAQAQLGFLRAHSQVELNTRAVERAQLLLSADVIGSAELQRRQNELTVAQAEKRAASDQLKALGLSEAMIRTLEGTGQIQPAAAITSTIGGTVIERRVLQGQVIQPTDVLFVVSDLTHVWASAELPEQDAQFVRVGQRVEVEIPALADARLAGRVAFVADVVNPETRTVRVSVDLANPDRVLKPSMLITMLIEGGQTERQVVPAGAVVRENDRDHVFVATAARTYRLTAVELGPEKDGKRPLLKPLPEDARIVVDGAFHLNNVRNQRALSGG